MQHPRLQEHITANDGRPPPLYIASVLGPVVQYTVWGLLGFGALKTIPHSLRFNVLANL
jgi:hypothetical protein